jgi:hypothetical protein
MYKFEVLEDEDGQFVRLTTGDGDFITAETEFNVDNFAEFLRQATDALSKMRVPEVR